MRAALVVLALALAGCGGGDATPAGLPVGADGEVLPTLQGLVVDDAVRPLANVSVRFLLEPMTQAVTDADGHYEILRPTLAAQDMLVTAEAPGYKTRTQQVQVSGHKPATLDFRLEADPPPLARVDILQYTGPVRCTAVSTAPPPADAVGCDPDHGDGGEQPEPPAWIWPIEPERALAGAVLQVHWEATTPASARLHAWLKAPVAGGKGGVVVAEATGTGPFRLELPEAAAREMPPYTQLWLGVELAPGELGEPGVAFQQPYEAYASLFYVDPAPVGYLLG